MRCVRRPGGWKLGAGRGWDASARTWCLKQECRLRAPEGLDPTWSGQERSRRESGLGGWRGLGGQERRLGPRIGEPRRAGVASWAEYLWVRMVRWALDRGTRGSLVTRSNFCGVKGQAQSRVD